MTNRWLDLLIVLVIAVLVILIGGIYIERSRFGLTESAILYLAGIAAAGLFWIGRKK